MDPYLGTIILWPCQRIPINWAVCNGQLLSITQYQALYALLGTTYGGDGVSNFALPDFRSRLPLGVGTYTAQNQAPVTYPLASKNGVESVVLTTANLPAHTHAPTVTNLKLSASMSVPASTSPAGNPTNTGGKSVLASPNSPEDTTAVINMYGPVGNTQVLPGSVSVTANGSPVTVQSAGLVSPLGHSNIQPVVGINYLICTTGLFPVNPNN